MRQRGAYELVVRCALDNGKFNCFALSIVDGICLFFCHLKIHTAPGRAFTMYACALLPHIGPNCAFAQSNPLCVLCVSVRFALALRFTRSRERNGYGGNTTGNRCRRSHVSPSGIRARIPTFDVHVFRNGARAASHRPEPFHRHHVFRHRNDDLSAVHQEPNSELLGLGVRVHYPHCCRCRNAGRLGRRRCARGVRFGVSCGCGYREACGHGLD